MTSIPFAMTTVKEIGEVKIIPSIQQIEWRISDFFTVAEDEEDLCLVSSSFPVRGLLWYLRFWPSEGDLFLAFESYQGSSSIYLAPDAHREYSLEYYFGLKKCDGTVEHLVNGIVKKDEAINTKNYDFISKTQLLQRKSELVPDNVLTIVCTVKWVAEVSQSNAQPETLLDNAKALQLISLDKLSDNFKAAFGDKETCDVTLKVQGKEYRAHRFVLMARSSVFAANFKHDTLERQTGVITIPDCDPDSFKEFLDFLYSGKLEELSYRSALNLYYTSNKYDVEELKVFCIEYLMKCLTVENVCEIAVFADQHDETQLYKVVQEFFNENSLKIFLIPDWENLMKKDYRLASKLLTEMSNVKLKN